MTDADAPIDPGNWEDALIADLRANNGRPSQGPLAGHPLLLMYSTGAKSGQRRRSVLTYSRDGDDIIVAGTAGGSATAPAWVANVSHDPKVDLEIANEIIDATAVVVEGAVRDRLWNQHVEQLPWFADYPAQVGARVIPIVRLSRRSAA